MIILVLVAALLLSLPLMVLLLLYNVFGNCSNMVDKHMVDCGEEEDGEIEDLPPEIDSIENLIFSCDPSLTLRKVQAGLADEGTLDLSSKPDMSMEELENITVLLLSLNPRKYRMSQLNLDDSRLTDEKLRGLAPLIVRFRTVKIGGKQDYGQRGLEELRLYMEKVNGLAETGAEEVLPVVKSEKVLLRRLEIKQVKSKIGMTDFTWVNEEVKGIENEDEKSRMVNELSHMIPHLHSLVLDGFLRESAAKPVNSIIGKTQETQLWQLWRQLNSVQHMQLLSLRDCDITERTVLRCLAGLVAVTHLDLSGNPDLGPASWRGLADQLLDPTQALPRLTHLTYQNSKHAVEEATAEQFSRMFLKLQRLDLKHSQLTEEAALQLVRGLDRHIEPQIAIQRLNLIGCNLSLTISKQFEEINQQSSSTLVLFRAYEAETRYRRGCTCFTCCCCCMETF